MLSSLGIATHGLIKRTPLYIATAGLLGFKEAEQSTPDKGTGVFVAAMRNRQPIFEYLPLPAIAGTSLVYSGLASEDAINIDLADAYGELYIVPTVEARAWAAADVYQLTHLPLVALARGASIATGRIFNIQLYSQPPLPYSVLLDL